MKIAVCITQVPDTATRLKIGPDARRIDEQAISYVVNPYDEFAIEAGLQIKEARGGEVTAIGLGPERVGTALRTALALGCDQAVHLLTEGALDDPFQQSEMLADLLKKRDFELILLGKQWVDDDSQAQGPMLAALLGFPCVTEVVALEVGSEDITATREVEGGKQQVSARLPALITTQKGLNEPRYASLKGIMAAKKKTIETEQASVGTARLEVVALELPPARKAGRIVGEGAETVPELVRLLREEAKAI